MYTHVLVCVFMHVCVDALCVCVIFVDVYMYKIIKHLLMILFVRFYFPWHSRNHFHWNYIIASKINMRNVHFFHRFSPMLLIKWLYIFLCLFCTGIFRLQQIARCFKNFFLFLFYILNILRSLYLKFIIHIWKAILKWNIYFEMFECI